MGVRIGNPIGLASKGPVGRAGQGEGDQYMKVIHRLIGWHAALAFNTLGRLLIHICLRSGIPKDFAVEEFKARWDEVERLYRR
jgi:hypothetical protein